MPVYVLHDTMAVTYMGGDSADLDWIINLRNEVFEDILNRADQHFMRFKCVSNSKNKMLKLIDDSIRDRSKTHCGLFSGDFAGSTLYVTVITKLDTTDLLDFEVYVTMRLGP